MRIAFALALLTCVRVGSADETIRCGRWVVNSAITVGELLHKCGEPASREVVEHDVRAVGQHGGSIKVGTTSVEYWIYDRGSRAAAVRVTIADGKVKSIERIQ